MQQTLYSKPMDGYPHKHPTIQSTIYTTPTENPVFQYLQVNNYLGEFKSEVDKARVRENLGIPDEYSYNWGHIKGNIQNQSDLMAILNQLTKKQSSLESQLLGVSSTVNQLAGTGEQDQITVNQLYSQFLDLKINVAQNSTDITSLITGGDTTLSNRVTALESKTTSDINNLQSIIETLSAQINSLQQEIGGNVTTGISASRTSISATPNSSNISITITASYSKLKDQDVTELCTVQVEDETVVTWENGYIIINSELEETKSTNVNFTYDGFTVSIPVNVVVSAPIVQVKQYVGFASNASQIFENSMFECNSVAKVWDSTTPVYGTPWYYFFIITTQNIASISEVGNYNLNEIRDGQLTSQNGTVYTVYKIGPVSSTEGLNINVTIQ